MEAIKLSELPNKLHLILAEDIPLCLKYEVESKSKGKTHLTL